MPRSLFHVCRRIGPLRRLWRIRRADCVLALVALLGVLVLGILAGLAVAVGLSLAVIVWRAGEGRLQLIGSRHHETSDDGDDDPVSPPGLLVARPLQMLFFVNAAEIREAVQAAVTAAEQHPDVMLLDLGLTPDLDVPALDTLTELRGNLRAAACRLWLVTGIDEVRDRLNRAGVSDPAVHVFNDISGGVRAYLSLHSTGPDTARGAALTDVLGYLQQRRDDPDLDERARVVLDDIEHRIRRELDDK